MNEQRISSTFRIADLEEHDETSFEWDDHYVTGLAEVDQQHRRLVDVINQLGALLTRPSGAPADEVERIFGELAAYAVYHFRAEEQLQAERGLDPEYLAAHQLEHYAFLDEVTRLHAALSPTDPLSLKRLLQFLIHWLAYHILGSDQGMAAQMRAIHGGATPRAAFEAEAHGQEGAVGPLVRALHGLFRQVSERNRALVELNQTLEARVEERTHALAEANQRLQEMAMSDVLTALPNRRHALARLAQLWHDGAQSGAAMACLMIDADGFKQVNDQHGHDAGDTVLREVARTLQHAVRTDDFVARLGGDEFLVLCPQTTHAGALQLGEKLRAAVAQLQVRAKTGAWHGSVSIGVATQTPTLANPEELVRLADEGVYLAKAQGRNCVATAQDVCI